MNIHVEIEVPRGSLIKRKADGSIDFISPVPCPYNYGYVIGTVGGDGDPVDAIVLGPRLRRGHRARHRARAALRFIDAGDIDDKVVCSIRPLTLLERRALELFFMVYVHAKRALNGVRGARQETLLQGWVAVDEALPRAAVDQLASQTSPRDTTGATT